jgi:hypothetical protein
MTTAALQCRVPVAGKLLADGVAQQGEGVNVDVDLDLLDELAGLADREATSSMLMGEDASTVLLRGDGEDGEDGDDGIDDDVALASGSAIVAVASRAESTVPSPFFVEVARGTRTVQPLVQWVQDFQRVAIWAFPILHPLYPATFPDPHLPAALHGTNACTGAAESHHRHTKRFKNLQLPMAPRQWAEHMHHVCASAQRVSTITLRAWNGTFAPYFCRVSYLLFNHSTC